MAAEMHQFVLVFAGKFDIDAELTGDERQAALDAKRAEILGAGETALLELGTVTLDMAQYQIDEQRGAAFSA